MSNSFDDIDATHVLLDVLYRVASDPEAWETLVDVLPLDDDIPRGTTPLLQRDLHRSVEIAETVAARVAHDASARPAAVIHLSMRLQIQQINGLARAAPGALETGRTLVLADTASETALARARQSVRGSKRPVILVMTFAKATGPTVASLSNALDGYILSFIPPAAVIGNLDRWLGLSPAESKLANILRHSGGLKEAAEQLGVRTNTARNQLASIFEKLGISRQSELIRILTELASPDAQVAQGDAQTAPSRLSLKLPDGRLLAYREYGRSDGRVLLAFHEGLGSSLLPPQTDEIADRLGLRIICADRPGFGGSDRLADHDFSKVAADMEMLCDRLDVHTLVIAGLLSGTAPALTTALRLGKRVERVLLLSGRAPQATPDEGLNPLQAFRLRLQRHGWASPTIFRLLKTRVSPAMVARMLERATRNSPGDRDYLDAHPETARLVSAYVTEALAADGLGPSDELAATHPTFDLSGLQASLLLFHGDEDSLAPLDELRRYLGQHPYGLTRFPRIGQLMTLKH